MKKSNLNLAQNFVSIGTLHDRINFRGEIDEHYERKTETKNYKGKLKTLFRQRLAHIRHVPHYFYNNTNGDWWSVVVTSTQNLA